MAKIAGVVCKGLKVFTPDGHCMTIIAHKRVKIDIEPNGLNFEIIKQETPKKKRKRIGA
jgi:hypothetical protein